MMQHTYCTHRQLRSANVASGLAPDVQFIVRPKAAGTRHAQLGSLSGWVWALLLLRFEDVTHELGRGACRLPSGVR